MNEFNEAQVIWMNGKKEKRKKKLNQENYRHEISAVRETVISSICSIQWSKEWVNDVSWENLFMDYTIVWSIILSNEMKETVQLL